MKRRTTQLFLLTALGVLGVLLATSASARGQNRTPPNVRKLTYHEHPPTEPLPTTLNPARFTENRAAFVAYALAGRIKDVLYQVPCYCPCDKIEGHQSLLDCYTSRHGVACPTCQKEAFFCFLQHKKGKSPAQIRKALAATKLSELDLAALTDHFYVEIQGNHR